MGKYILVFGIVFLSFFAFGQEHRFSFGLTGSMDKYNFDFKQFDGYDHKQTNDLAYSIGLGFQYLLSEKLSLGSGVSYTEKAYKVEYDFILIDLNGIYTHADIIDPYIPKESNLKIIYLNVPLMFGYVLIDKGKFKLRPSAGIINEFLIGESESTVFGNSSATDSDNLSKNLSSVLFSAQVNVGFEYNFDRNAFLTFEPYLRCSLTNLDDEGMNSNPISYGAILSINYKWGRGQ